MNGLSVANPCLSRSSSAYGGEGWESLTAIFDPTINLAWATRRSGPGIRDFVDTALISHPDFSWRGVCEQAAELGDLLPGTLKKLPGFSCWAADLALQVQAFQTLFEPEAVGVRLHGLSQAMCPRFHVDQVPVRLITTYAGSGTEWL